MFDVSYDRAERILKWRLSGFWTPATVTQFAAALKLEYDRIPAEQPFDALGDARAFPVQSREVAEALGVVMGYAARLQRGRTALVVASALNKLQAERSVVGDDMRAFLTLEDALAWLRPAPAR